MRKLILAGFIFCWAAGGSYILTLIHASHYANIQDVEELKVSSVEEGKWGIYHFFDTRCSCSNSILKSLLKRKAINDQNVRERIYFYPNLSKNAQTLERLGYDLKRLNFSKLGITGVPLLLIFDMNKTVRYAGGYSNQRINPLNIPDEKALVSAVMQGREMASKPIIGCSVSKKYQKILDPLGLKYGNIVD